MQHHLFYRLLIISCTFFLISCQQTIECYLIPSTDKASDFHKVQPQNSGTLFLAKNEAEHIQIVFKGCPGETYKIHRNGNDDNSIRYSCRQIKSVYGFDDALVPLDGEQITLNDSIAKLWITFRTAESIRPGKYEEQISIDGNGKRQKIKKKTEKRVKCLTGEKKNRILKNRTNIHRTTVSCKEEAERISSTRLRKNKLCKTNWNGQNYALIIA